ncbi:MAG: hypothetical protein AAF548_15475 [Actinomycetota bacterium]
MSLQLELDAFKSVADTRFPPGDFVLLASLLVAPGSLRLRRSPVGMLPLAFVATMSYGVLLALTYAGNVSSNALQVKLFGTLSLGTWCLVTIYYVQRGHVDRIVKTWVVGMLFWGVVSYIDWRVANILPGLDAKTSSRFGGMQFDPNNAGAAFGVVAVVTWRFGHRMFATAGARFLALGLACAFLGLTFSRGGLIGALLTAMVIFVVGRDSATRRARAVAAAVFIFGAAVVSGYVSDALESYSVRPDTVSTRDMEATRAIEELAESRGLGIGLGTHLENNPQIVHNTAIWLTVEMSIVGLMFFGLLLSVPTVVTLRGRRYDPDLAMAILAGHLVMIVASMGIEAIMQRQWWLLVGLCAAPSLRAAPTPRADPQRTPVG